MRYVSLLLASLLVFACSKDDPGDLSQETPSQSTTMAGSPPPSNTAITQPMEQASDNPAQSVTPAGPTQEVHLIEYSIHMPQTLRAGRVAFNIENGGKEDHAFEIEGNGIEEKSPVLKRGDTTSLEVDLKPGTYTIYCPVDGHKDKGMKTTVRVE